MAYGLWTVAYGLCSVTFGLLACGLWPLPCSMCGLSPLAFGPVAHGVGRIYGMRALWRIYGVLLWPSGLWPLASSLWPMAHMASGL